MTMGKAFFLSSGSSAPSEPTPRSEPPPAAIGQAPGFSALFVASAIVATLDLASKRWAASALATSPRELVSGSVGLLLAKNRGAAWSMLGNLPDHVRLPLFVVVTVTAFFVVLRLYARATTASARIATALILGGAAGNLVDRLRHGYVVDFIDLHARWSGALHHWPIFNVADIAIVTGVLLLARQGLVRRRLS
jgi:signal peptidase II